MGVNYPFYVAPGSTPVTTPHAISDNLFPNWPITNTSEHQFQFGQEATNHGGYDSLSSRIQNRPTTKKKAPESRKPIVPDTMCRVRGHVQQTGLVIIQTGPGTGPEMPSPWSSLPLRTVQCSMNWNIFGSIPQACRVLWSFPATRSNR